MIGDGVDHYISRREWLTRRFESIMGELRRTGLRGMPIEELCKEAAEVACWIGEEEAREAVHYSFAKRVSSDRALGPKTHG